MIYFLSIRFVKIKISLEVKTTGSEADPDLVGKFAGNGS